MSKISLLAAISPKVADNAKVEYEGFLKNDVTQNSDKFSSFDFSTDRLDEFFTQFLNGNPKYTSFNTVCIYIFVISHGQASVERGFNINKEMVVG